MLERPALDDATLLTALRDGYGLPIDDLAFVPLGNDSAAWTYRAAAADGRAWFVKVRRDPRPAGILVPRYLHDLGMTEVIAARPTQDGRPWLEVGPWSVLVYPFVDDRRAMDGGLVEAGWRRLGTFAARLHATVLPPDLAALVPVEDFRPKANEMAERVADHVTTGPGRGPDRDDIARRAAAAWVRHRPVIERLVRRSDELARQIREGIGLARPLRFVPCHADLHIGNVLVGADGGLSIVDWDEVVLAPPERDLMFVRGSAIAGVVTDREATAFEGGYGSGEGGELGEAGEADPLLIAWYRIDWAVQDIADFARRALLDPDVGTATRANALALLESTFAPGDEVETALVADERLRASPSGLTP